MKTCFLVAGGTGGHINSAIAFSDYLNAKNLKVYFITGKRELDYKLLKNYSSYNLDACPLRSNNPFKQLKSIFQNLFALFQSIFLIIKHKPEFIFGAGGYVCGPTLLAGKILGKKVYILEQNAVMGVTNKIVAKFADKIFVNFSETQGITENDKSKTFYVGNPTRSSVKWTPNKVTEKINILVIGGSLGADQINQSMNHLLKMNFGKKIFIKHQVGLNKKFDLKFDNSEIEYVQLEYIDDIQKEFEWSNIVISRAGASAISELRVIERPSILIPYPAATDNHQEINAKILKKENVFPVYIINKKLKENELALEIHKSIVDILRNKDSFTDLKKSYSVNTSEKIWNEITND
jgi:UDP-N-acetylglucosamine--N-acetylmuramyl-(pentapeptide) pyrophosphoryl-undecaprenol N-acetylglucosamine transferase